MAQSPESAPPPEVDLALILRELNPELRPGSFVFTTMASVPADLDYVAVVSEDEGTTVVLPRESADARGLPYDYVAAQITLTVRSSLAAVGLTAAVTTALAAAGISANVVAGFHHDHLFVPAGRATAALAVLRSLTTGSPAER
jgi:uncharacterized protein